MKMRYQFIGLMIFSVSLLMQACSSSSTGGAIAAAAGGGSSSSSSSGGGCVDAANTAGVVASDSFTNNICPSGNWPPVVSGSNETDGGLSSISPDEFNSSDASVADYNTSDSGGDGSSSAPFLYISNGALAVSEFPVGSYPETAVALFNDLVSPVTSCSTQVTVTTRSADGYVGLLMENGTWTYELLAVGSVAANNLSVVFGTTFCGATAGSGGSPCYVLLGLHGMGGPSILATSVSPAPLTDGIVLRATITLDGSHPIVAATANGVNIFGAGYENTSDSTGVIPTNYGIIIGTTDGTVNDGSLNNFQVDTCE